MATEGWLPVTLDDGRHEHWYGPRFGPAGNKMRDSECRAKIRRRDKFSEWEWEVFGVAKGRARRLESATADAESALGLR